MGVVGFFFGFRVLQRLYNGFGFGFRRAHPETGTKPRIAKFRSDQ